MAVKPKVAGDGLWDGDRVSGDEGASIMEDPVVGFLRILNNPPSLLCAAGPPVTAISAPRVCPTLLTLHQGVANDSSDPDLVTLTCDNVSLSPTYPPSVYPSNPTHCLHI